MKFLDYLQENYVAIGEVGNDTITIYKNPTKEDLIQMRKDMDRAGESHLHVKMVADFKNKNLYIWDSWIAIHNDALNILKQQGILNFTDRSISRCSYMGSGYVELRKLYGSNFYPSYHVNYKGFVEATEENSAWLQKYFRNKIEINHNLSPSEINFSKR